ncbi:protein AGENET DOMAIN (AGD)-CONTAINING P1-like [Lotus japonicus]|uniref:protein AGENET DOMAIN (AGD)-CONTAINING P1-like n=1 Tax=Lotus japonicus TaxID=34305 RepID=UPI0025849E08|nr:protein AGENET DOMAIN (AGD)-CONTAINING P1-like [Lotus japonicus]
MAPKCEPNKVSNLKRGTKPLTESMNICRLQTLPLSETHHDFKSSDKVDAHHEGSLWESHVTKESPNGSEEQIEFSKEELRPHRAWINDHLQEHFDETMKVVVKAVEAVNCDETVEANESWMQENEELFSVKAPVEVSFDEEGFVDTWYASTIFAAMGPGKFLVKLRDLFHEDSSSPLIEEIDARHIRPPPPKTGVANFRLLDEVDALESDGWWRGVIIKVFNKSKYKVHGRSNTEELVCHPSELRLHHDWVDGRWVNDLRVSTAKKLKVDALLLKLQEEERQGGEQSATAPAAQDVSNEEEEGSDESKEESAEGSGEASSSED